MTRTNCQISDVFEIIILQIKLLNVSHLSIYWKYLILLWIQGYLNCRKVINAIEWLFDSSTFTCKIKICYFLLNFQIIVFDEIFVLLFQIAHNLKNIRSEINFLNSKQWISKHYVSLQNKYSLSKKGKPSPISYQN